MSGNIDAGSKSLKLDYEAKTTTVFLLNNSNNVMSLHAGLVQRYSVSDLRLTGLTIVGDPRRTPRTYEQLGINLLPLSKVLCSWHDVPSSTPN